MEETPGPGSYASVMDYKSSATKPNHHPSILEKAKRVGFGSQAERKTEMSFLMNVNDDLNTTKQSSTTKSAYRLNIRPDDIAKLIPGSERKTNARGAVTRESLTPSDKNTSVIMNNVGYRALSKNGS